MCKKKNFLGILTYFKNERSSIYEWILHYRKWGVDHIWMIDNGSEDDYDINEFINDGFVTLYQEPNLGQQDSYNKYLPYIKNEVEWLGVFDMDEFLYSKEDDNLKKVIAGIDQTIKTISIQMTIFFPTTFESSASVIESNILRRSFDSNNHPKSLYNLDFCDRVDIHKLKLDKKLHLEADNTLLCINHYRYTSFEYLYGIKEGRGGGIHKRKYKSKYSRFLVLIKSLDDNFLSNDTYLRDRSQDVIEQSKKVVVKPCIELYPESSWLYLKNNLKDKYEQFKRYNDNNQLLNHQQINEINMFLNNISEKYC